MLALLSMQFTNFPDAFIHNIDTTLRAYFATFNLPALVWRPYLDLHSAPYHRAQDARTDQSMQVTLACQATNNPVKDN